MVATRPIKAFEPVVLDQALAFGPCEHTKPRCLACLKLLDEVSTVCPECNLPMCDLEVINVKLAVIVFACWTLANHRWAKSRKKRVQFMDAVLVFAPKSEINILEKKIQINFDWPQIEEIFFQNP